MQRLRLLILLGIVISFLIVWSNRDWMRNWKEQPLFRRTWVTITVIVFVSFFASLIILVIDLLV